MSNLMSFYKRGCEDAVQRFGLKVARNWAGTDQSVPDIAGAVMQGRGPAPNLAGTLTPAAAHTGPAWPAAGLGGLGTKAVQGKLAPMRSVTMAPHMATRPH